jgi:rhamnosyltransferase
MLNKNYCNDVSAVLVTYNPNIEILHAAIQAVLKQVSAVFIVDNASANFSVAWFDQLEFQAKAKLHLLQQEENLGIGVGHNIGIRQAFALGSKFVLLLDQDSQVESDMVLRLRSAYDELSEKGFQVAALGSQYRDTASGVLSGFIQVNLLPVHRIHTDNPNMVDADFIVSSGSLLSVAALEIVGLMDERLFIDGVDTEWCFRAKSKGFQIFGVCGAVMTHTLGEQRRVVFKRIIPFHKPFRYYYMFRNSVLLYRRSYMPWRWIFADIARYLKMVIFFSWVAENRLKLLRMMCLGIMDGLKGISGKRNDL